MSKKVDKGVSKARKVWGLGKKSWKWLQTRGEHARLNIERGYAIDPYRKTKRKKSKKKRKRRRRK